MRAAPIGAAQNLSDLTCYLAGQAKTADIDQSIWSLLEESGIEVTDLLPPRRTLPDFAIFVAMPALSVSMSFEIGLFVGEKRPVLLVTQPGLSLPLLLEDLPRIDWPTRGVGLQFQLTSFVRSQVLSAGRRRPKPNSRPAVAADSGTKFSQQLHDVDLSARDFEQLIVRALKAGGISVAPLPLSATGTRVVEADSAIWIPELEPLNPVIVGVKKRNKPATKDLDALFALLASTGQHLGVLVYPDGVQAPYRAIGQNMSVVVLSARMLNDLSPTGPLVSSLREARNELVHRDRRGKD